MDETKKRLEGIDGFQDFRIPEDLIKWINGLDNKTKSILADDLANYLYEFCRSKDWRLKTVKRVEEALLRCEKEI